MKFDFDATYFNPLHTLDCGQVFRFKREGDAFIVLSADKLCKVRTDGVKTVVESDDCDYFYGYFDLGRDYREIVERAKSYSFPLLSRSAESCRGLRLLNQNKEETIYSFIISQNNNIPRIKGIIERICTQLGERRESLGESYYTFPASAALAAADASVFKAAGAGYRDVYLSDTSARIAAEGISALEKLDGEELYKALLGYKGIGPKVADCISLFGFGCRSRFPVDVWIEKVYREEFSGELSDRKAISQYFCKLFGEYSGYMQQYMFYGKRLML